MRTNHLQLVFKVVFLAAAAIIVCSICAVAASTSNSGKAMIDNGTSQVSGLLGKNGDITEQTYHGNSLVGSELVGLIKDTVENKDMLSIVVLTLQGSRTDYNYTYDEDANTIATGGTTAIQDSKAQVNYINRTSVFLCSVKKDANDNIICLWFEQQP